ncbi:Zn-dependent protease (includes SpoIVFB) [Thermanaeromonas toyohensis ToBE]|uniref:Zn-dependent protease (Includes SpoIVFB) n=1 Tax=Thermanaeromonas toyohensis ToBE TaxID=698762 RepID=A0A1W1VZA9_9FIRM|nr:site-2 protease family protein [Thermanaeromonas toyohensis]SMB98451.1 Zn-dependent protease (includes SpoIVFB) [Thermanaeromonas toyohensis ToBE]
MYLDSFTKLLAGIPALLLALAFHEYAHGKVAYLLGDPTPKYQGRLTLNPLAHLDLLGTLLLIVAGFGWAKPVQVNPFYFQMDRRKGMMLVALAGPLMNLVLAYLGAVAWRLSGSWGWRGDFLFAFFNLLVVYNVVLAVFNLLPIPPLDGSRILAGLVSRESASFLYRLETIGPFLLLFLIATGVTGRIMRPLVSLVLDFILQASRLTII